MALKSKQEQHEALEAERDAVVKLLDIESVKDFSNVEDEQLRVQKTKETQATVDQLTLRLNQIDMALTMLCVGGIDS